MSEYFLKRYCYLQNTPGGISAVTNYFSTGKPQKILSRLLRLLLICWLSGGSAHVFASELTIYTEEWPPISFSTNKAADGMAVEVVRAIQARVGNKSVIQVVPWARGYAELLSQPDVMLFTVGVSEERERMMTLVGPLAVAKTEIYSRKGNSANLLALGDKIYSRPVGAYRSSIFADSAKKHGFSVIDLAATPQLTARKLFEGRVDMWVEGSFVVSSVLNDIGRSPEEVERVMTLDSLEIYLAFSLGTAGSVVDAWENALREIKNDGSFGKIHHKWLPKDAVPLKVKRLGLPPQQLKSGAS